MSDDMLRPDCSRCVGLCCVALAFDRSALFAFDKPAGEVCSNLDTEHRCTIHGRLAETGFGGCVQFDCLGAGQRATALFEDPRHDGRMFESFARMRQIHELLQLLDGAGRLPLTPVQSHRRESLAATLSADWTLAQFAALDFKALSGEVMAFLQSLRDLASPARAI